MVSARSQEGDSWMINVRFGGETVSAGGKLPTDMPMQNVAMLVSDAMGYVVRTLRAQAEQQEQIAREVLDGE
jgi:hypothetical protein